MGEQTVVEQRPLPAGQGERTQQKRVRSEALIERDLSIYRRHMSGLSIRAICDEFGIKSTATVHAAIGRGRAYALERGIDAEEHRLEINELFRDTLLKLHGQVSYQAEHGCETLFINDDGSKSVKLIKGIDPRIAAELGRSLHRWSEFLGLMERAPEQNVQATTVVLSAPAAGADFESRYSSLPSADAGQQVVETQASPAQSTVISEGGPGWGAAA